MMVVNGLRAHAVTVSVLDTMSGAPQMLTHNPGRHFRVPAADGLDEPLVLLGPEAAHLRCRVLGLLE
jgi:hypothetical protein